MRTEVEFPSALLLDSGGGWLGGQLGGCLTFGKPSFTLFSGISGAVMIHGDEKRKIKGDPVREIEEKTSEGYTAVGFFGYEYLKNTDDGRFVADKPPGEKSTCGGFEHPFLGFHFYDRKSIGSAGKDTKQIRSLISAGKNRSPNRPPPGISAAPLSHKKQFVQMVEKIKSHISGGDVYQVNISRARNFTAPENAPDFFLNFFNSQPVPFAAYMDFGSFQFLSGSMEMFLKKTGNEIISRPIKGTIGRGKNPREDYNMRKTLATSEKEKAEILMITDLMRNDLSRICVPSSVRTRGIFNVRPYKTLFHMESEILGNLKKDISISEIIRKTFPPGSVTGAPKTKAVEIIDSLEPHSRGPYCGTAGIFYPGGDFCLSVSIRCLEIVSDKAVCWSGAGIVWDSDPEKEFEETALKLRALEKASRLKK